MSAADGAADGAVTAGAGCVNSDLGESEFELLMWAVQGQSVPYTPHIARVTPKLGESKMLYFPRPPSYILGVHVSKLQRLGVTAFLLPAP